MSASLVGSEMCIRDRKASSQLQAKHRRRRRGAAGGARRRLGPTAGRQAPVSYTHLTLPTICSV
eukprot:13377176-Alexandrium_andersonii.AAC.1